MTEGSEDMFKIYRDFYLYVKFVNQLKRGPVKGKRLKVARSMLGYESG